MTDAEWLRYQADRIESEDEADSQNVADRHREIADRLERLERIEASAGRAEIAAVLSEVATAARDLARPWSVGTLALAHRPHHEAIPAIHAFLAAICESPRRPGWRERRTRAGPT